MIIKRKSQWDVLFKFAVSIIDGINSDNTIIDSWSFGGGTAMMLQISHRESHDIDIFIDDPQYIAYIMAFLESSATRCNNYYYDGGKYVRIVCDEGEIDFIVASQMTDNALINREIFSRSVRLESIGEIIAKKIHYRGSSVQPRDIFDIAACISQNADEVSRSISHLKSAINQTITAMDRMNQEFYINTISQLMIKKKYKRIVSNSFHDVRLFLSDMR